MAAIFQLRRGTTNETLSDGELYLHKTSGSIQFGSGSSNVITLLPLNVPAYGNINLIGNISASGDVRIGGNIYLGDNLANDSVNVNSPFSGSIIPSGSNVFDLGSVTTVYRNVYANNISASSFTGSLSGSINGVNFTPFSTSVDSRLDQLETDSGSQNTRITTLESKATTLQTYTASVDSRLSNLEGDTGSYATTGSNVFVANQTISGSLVVSGSNIELTRDWPVVGTESHLFRLSPFTSSTNRYYDGLSIGVEHWDDGTGTYEHSLLIHSFDDDTVQNYGAELNVGPYRTHMRVYPSGSNGSLSNISVQELSNGKTQALVYGDYVQIGALVGQDILMGNSGSLIVISGSNMLLDTPLTSSEAIVASLFSGSISGIGNVTEFSSSISDKFLTISNVTTSFDGRLDRLEESTQSLNDYTQSLKNAIDVTGGDTRILGNLIVDGTQTSLNTTNTYIEDKSITLASGSTTSNIADGAGFNIAGANVSMSWEDSNQRLYFDTNVGIEGAISASTFTGLNGASLTTYSTSVDSRLSNLQSKSASVDISISEINNFTSSQNNKDVIISNITSSYNAFTGSATASIVELFATASNHEIRIDSLETKAGTLETYTASVDRHITDINSYTSSNNTLNTLQTTRIDQLAESTASVNSFSASATASIVELFGTASNHEGRIDDLESKATTLQTYTASIEDRFTTISNVTTSLNLHTASLNLFTSSTYSNFSTSVDNRLDQLEYTTSILTPEGQAESFNAINTFTGSANNRLNNLELTSASLNLFSSSLNTTFATDSELNAVSLSISTSIEILSQSVDNRLDSVELFTSSINTTIKTKLDIETVVSSSSQLTSSFDTRYLNTGGDGIYSSSAQIQGNIYSAGSSFTIQDIVIGAGTTFGKVTTDGSKYISIMPTFNVESARFWANGNVTIQDAGNYVDNGYRLEVSGSTRFVGDTTITNSLNVTGGITGSIAATNGVVSGSSQLTGSLVDLTSDQTITGTKTFNDIVVNGTGSFAYISSVSGSAKIIGDSYVVLNNNTPTQRYAGIAIYDSGSATPTTASFNFDGQTNDWFYEYSASTVDYAVTLFGPEYTTKGSPTYLTTNRIPKSDGTHHLNDSNISDTGTLITLGSNSIVNGTFYATGTPLVSGSAQVLDMLSSLNTYTGSNDTLNTLQTTRIDQLAASTSSVNSFTESVLGHIVDINTYTGSNNTLNSLQTTRIDQLAASTASVNSFTSSIDTTIKTKLNVEGVVSGSSQITLSSTTGGGTSANVQFGSLGIGTAASGVSGEIRATGDIVAFYSSDERLKENITPIENAVDKINQMGGYTYDWKEGFETIHSHTGNDLGVIAQEVQSVLPEVVTERETGYLAVDYVKLVPVLIEAIKELSAKIDRLENK